MHSDLTGLWVLPWFVAHDSSPELIYYFHIQAFYLIWVANQSVMKMAGASLRSIWASCWERHGQNILLKGHSTDVIVQKYTSSNKFPKGFVFTFELVKIKKKKSSIDWLKLNQILVKFFSFDLILHFRFKNKIHTSSELARERKVLVLQGDPEAISIPVTCCTT